MPTKKTEGTEKLKDNNRNGGKGRKGKMLTKKTEGTEKLHERH